MLPDSVLVRVATFVASNCVENPKGAIERLLKLRASKRLMAVAETVICGPVARVMRTMLPQFLSTRAGMITARSSSPGFRACILSRLVDLSEAARRGDPGAAHAAALIESARDLLRESLESATVGTERTKGPMYDDPEQLAHEVIERLKRRPFEPITENLETTVRGFLRGTSDARAKCTHGPMCLWDVSAIADFSWSCATAVPNVAPPFNSDLFWNTSSAANMGGMFCKNTEFKGDLSTWDVSNVTHMNGMFEGAGIEDSGIGNWNTSNVRFCCNHVRWCDATERWPRPV